MAWFKKKEEQEIQEDIPTLPELPNPNKFSLPELPPPISSKNQEDLPELPTLPELKTETNLTPEVIKQEIMKPPQQMHKSQFDNPPQISKIHSKPIPSQPIHHQPPQITTPEIVSPPPEASRSKSRVKEAEPIYVRLDKFEASLESFEEIKRKINEIEEVLRKTKEIKQKEELELEAWEREIQIMKSRITAIDKTMFNKLD